MAARKGIRARILERLRQGPMTGRQMEAMYIELGGAVDAKTKRVSFDTMRHLINGLPLAPALWDGKPRRSQLLDREYRISPEKDERMELARTEHARSRQLLMSLLSPDETGQEIVGCPCVSKRK